MGADPNTIFLHKMQLTRAKKVSICGVWNRGYVDLLDFEELLSFLFFLQTTNTCRFLDGGSIHVYVCVCVCMHIHLYTHIDSDTYVYI